MHVTRRVQVIGSNGRRAVAVQMRWHTVRGVGETGEYIFESPRSARSALQGKEDAPSHIGARPPPDAVREHVLTLGDGCEPRARARSLRAQDDELGRQAAHSRAAPRRRPRRCTGHRVDIADSCWRCVRDRLAWRLHLAWVGSERVHSPASGMQTIKLNEISCVDAV
jgi:hypothetical protein